MNTIWSDYVQNTGTLYLSRSLRFSDEYKKAYMDAFDIADRKRILEIGCGPGAVSEEEIREIKKRIDQRYEKRIELYNAGIKQWDTSMSLTMVLRGAR